MTSSQLWLEQSSPRLNTLWQGEWEPSFAEPGRYLYDHELVLVTKGNCRVHVASETHELSAGSFIIIPPGTYHTTVAGIDPVYRSCIHFDWSNDIKPATRPICAFHPSSPRKSWIMPTPSFVPFSVMVGLFATKGPVPLLVQTLFQRWERSDTFGHLLSRSTFLELLAHLFCPPSEKQRSAVRAVQIAHAAKDLLDQADSQTSVQSLLASLGFSYAHVSRLFRKNFGLTPVDYINACRLERARVLLTKQQLTVSEVAYAVGFNSPGYFSKKFREHHGITPGQSS